MGEDHVYTTSFKNASKPGSSTSVLTGLGILRAVKEDLQEGQLLTNLKSLVSAEIFSDFMEVAKHLLEAKYKDPAAFMAGAVLENGLRQIATANRVSVKDKDDISTLNQKLAHAGICNRMMRKKIQAWNDLRSYADHGNFDEYTEAEVSDMIRGVENLLANYL